LRYEDWQTKYKDILDEYKQEKQKTAVMMSTLHENQMRYIKRESEYKDVIQNVELKI
jgi:penicillin-binding protein-related factor A (putative recombinase)